MNRTADFILHRAFIDKLGNVHSIYESAILIKLNDYRILIVTYT
jgi:hypothetical protein